VPGVSYKRKVRYFLPLFAVLLAAVSCGGEDIEPAEWRLSEPPSGTTLKIQVAVGNGCNSIDSVKVDEFDDFVRVTAYSRYDEPPNGGCDDLLKIDPYEVHLQEPVGDRRLEGCDVEDSGGFEDLGGRTCKEAVIGPAFAAPTPTRVPSDDAPYPIVFGRRFTAAEANGFLESVGLTGFAIRWEEDDPCTGAVGCPYLGPPADESGCLIIQTVVDITRSPSNETLTRTQINWQSVRGTMVWFDTEWVPLPVGVEIGCRDEAHAAGLNTTPTPGS
jgi:hypothetical protein